MNHRNIIKGSIVLVIGIVIIWSVVNISEYAAHFHASIVVWSLGLALGTANALSVYAFVISSSKGSRVPAGVGIILFGGMSAILQFLLYLSAGAPIPAAIAFGGFGPVAEAVLSWLHAALSEDEAKANAEAAEQAEEKRRREAERQQRKAQKEAAKKPQKPQENIADSTPEQAPEMGEIAAPKAAQPELKSVPLTAKKADILERRRNVAALAAQGKTQEDIAAILDVGIRTVQGDFAELKKLGTTATNGASH